MHNLVRSGAAALIDLNDLRVFAYVASLGSFSLAAEALRLHKSSVSRSMTRLEAMLRTPLIQRTTRQVRLTSRGVALQQSCVDLLSGIQKAVGQGVAMRIAPQGLIARSGPGGLLPVPLGGNAAHQKIRARWLSAGRHAAPAASCSVAADTSS